MNSAKRGDIIQNIKSGYYWEVSNVYPYEYGIKPVDAKFGLKTGSRSTTIRKYSCVVVSKEELEKLITEKELKKMDKLYQFTHEGKTLFGHKLAVNSEGLWVMDVKGGAPVAIKAEEAEEVIPYSVSVKSLSSGETKHMMIDKGVVSKGGVYVARTGGIYTVLDVDTKTKTPLTFHPVSQLVTKDM